MHIIMAVVWLACAAGVFLYEHYTGDLRTRIRGTNLSIGWLLLVLGLYNLARWYSSRAYRREQEAIRIAEAARMRVLRDRDHPPPDPTFDFTNKPADPPARSPSDPPPPS
jgi:hypothetical protein